VRVGPVEKILPNRLVVCTPWLNAAPVASLKLGPMRLDRQANVSYSLVQWTPGEVVRHTVIDVGMGVVPSLLEFEQTHGVHVGHAIRALAPAAASTQNGSRGPGRLSERTPSEQPSPTPRTRPGDAGKTRSQRLEARP
jgi:hypothetical protein